MDGNPGRRLIVLNENYCRDNLDQLPDDLKSFNSQHDITVEDFSFKITYNHLSAEEVLRKILPREITEIPSSFEQVGHLAHVNLREEVLPYKNIIGQVILDKNSGLKTVVNKIGQIETEFRTFPMEVSHALTLELCGVCKAITLSN